MDKKHIPCNFLYPVVIKGSVPFFPLSVRIKREIRSSVKKMVRPEKKMNNPSRKPFSPLPEDENLNLEPGEWVQVRSFDEISRTLDENRKYKGAFFMPAMEKFCGKKFKVFKKVQVIKLESTGEVRKLKRPSVFLEGVYCDGVRVNGCERSCFHFWKEAWLKRIPEK
jgi:hypothetical protein